MLAGNPSLSKSALVMSPNVLPVSGLSRLAICAKSPRRSPRASVGHRFPLLPAPSTGGPIVLIGMTRWPARPQPADRNDPAPASLMRWRSLQHPVATQWLGIRSKVPASAGPSTPTASGDPCVAMTPRHVPDAVDVDRATRTGLRGISGEVFLHRSLAKSICRGHRPARLVAK